jgi:hypothetical protein
MTLEGYDQFLSGFRVVDPKYGPVPLWWWDAERITPERVRWQMEKLKSGGIRNLCVINLAPSGPNADSRGSMPPFYDESWWECFETAVRTAERLQMYLWYYDQIGFSGANFPAQIALANPDFRGFHLRRWPSDEASVGKRDPWFHQGRFTYGIERAGFDWLNPQATAVLLDRIHGEMERRFAPWFGSVIAGSFQDELPPMPTWSNQLLERYQRQFGRDLTPDIPQLFEGAENDLSVATIRRQVYEVLGALAEEAFFRPLGKWHARHHLILGCDQAGPGREVDPYGAQRLYLDYPRTHRWFSAPGNDPDGEIKPHASIAHQWGQPRVWLEAFHSSGWGGTVEETLHWLLPWYQAGATLYNPHAIYYSTMGGWWEWAAPDTGWRQPYFEHYSIFADGIARLSKALSQGRHVADIAVYYPGHALWPSMPWPSGTTPVHPMALAKRPETVRGEAIWSQYWNLVGRQNRNRPELGILRQARMDFDTLDDMALQAALLTNQEIHVGGESYRVLIFPGTEAIDEHNRDSVQRWIDQGGLAIGIGVPSEERTLHGVLELESADDLEASLVGYLGRRVDGPGQSLIRQIDDETSVMLLMPPEGTLTPMHGTHQVEHTPPPTVSYWIRTQGTIELWDPWRGTSQRLPTQSEGDGQRVNVPMTDWPAALLVVRQQGTPLVREDPTAKRLVHPYSAAVGRPGPRKIPVEDTDWTVRVEPTLDNRYRDFDRHWNQDWVGVEIRRVEVADDIEDVGVKQHWYRSNPDPSPNWAPRLWSEAAYWLLQKGPDDADEPKPVVYSTLFGDLTYRTWAGRMARVPRTFLSLGEARIGETRIVQSFVWVPKSGTYWFHVEGRGIKTVRVDGEEIVVREERYAIAPTPVSLDAGWRAVALDCEAVADGPLRCGVAVGANALGPYPEWVASSPGNRRSTAIVHLPKTFAGALVHFVVVDGAANLEVNGHQLAHLGDYMPYSHWGQQVLDAQPWLQGGNNTLSIEWTDDSAEGRAFVDGTWLDADGLTHSWDIGPWSGEASGALVPVGLSTEPHWLLPRPHLLPEVDWLEPDAKPEGLLAWASDPTRIGQPIWIRCQLPVGASRIRMALIGTAQAWVDDEAVAIHQGQIDLQPGAAGRRLVVRVMPLGPLCEAAVLQKPIIVETSQASGSLGDWAEVLALGAFSGVVEYERTVSGTATQAVIHLGTVRGTAELWVDGWNAGVRLWHPYQFDVSPAWGPGPHRIRIRVTNTLGAFYGDGKPSALCPEPQQRGGLYGPVQIFEP